MSLSRITTALFSLAALVLVVASCGGSGSNTTTSTSASSKPSAPSGGTMTVAAAEVSGVGTVLVDSEGLTVYTFAKDKGSTSSCYGACEKGWPPVIAKGQPSGEGAIASQLGTTKRKDGSLQVTYAGHPLYTFIDDSEPGEANGNGSTAFGGKWSVIEKSGEAGGSSAGGESEMAPEETESSESSGSGGGYGY